MADRIGDVVVGVAADGSGFPAALAAEISAAEPAADSAGAKVGTSVGKSISDGAAKAMSGVAAKIVDPLKKSVPAASQQAASSAGKAFAELGRTITRQMAAAGRTVGKAFSGISSTAGKAVSAVQRGFSRVGSGIQKALAPVGRIAGKAFSSISSVATRAATATQRAFDRVGSGVQKALAPIGRVATRAFGPIATAAGKAFRSIGPLAERAVQAASSAFSKLRGQAGKVFGGIRTQLGKAFSGMGSQASKGMSAAGSAVSGLTGKIGVLAAGALSAAGAVAGIGAFVTKGFGRLSSIENAQAKLSGLGNSAKDVESIMNNALAAVKGTAFGMGDAATIAASAVAAGIEPGQQLEKYLRLTANAAQLAGTDLSEMGDILNEVMLNGAADTVSIQQLQSRGLPVMAALAKSYGVSAQKMQEMVSAGEVDAKRFQSVLTDLVGNSAVKAADTVQGAWANLGAAVSRGGASLLTGTYGQLKESIFSITKLINSLEPVLGTVGKNLGKFLKPALDAFNKFASSVDTKGIGNALAVFSPVTTALKELIPVLSAVGSTFKGVIADQFERMGKAFSSIDPKPLIGALAMIGNAVQIVIQAFGKIDLSSLIGPLAGVFVSLAKVVSAILPPIMQLVSVLGGALGAILPTVAKGIGLVVSALSGSLGKIIPPIVSAITGLAKILGGALSQILPVVAQLIAGLAQVLGGALGAILPTLINMLGVVAKVIGDGLMKILPVLLPLVNAVAKVIGTILVQSFANIASVVNVLITTVLPPLIDVFVALMPILTQLISSLLPPLLDIFKALAPAIIPLLGLLAKLVVALLPLLVTVLKALTPLLTLLAKGIGFVLGKIADAIGWFVKWITTAGNVGKAFSTLGKAIGGFAASVGGWFKKIGSAIIAPFTQAGKKIAEFWTGTQKRFTSALSWVGSTWKKGWSNVSGWMSGAVQSGRTKIAGIWDRVTGKFSSARKWVGSTWRTSWSKVSGWMSDAVGKGRDRVGTILGNVRDRFSNMRTWTGSNWRKAWSNVSTWMSSAVGKGRDKIGGFLSGSRDRFSNFKSWVGNNWRKGWNKASDWIAHPIRNARDLIARIMGNKGVQKIFRSALTAINKIWSGLDAVMARPVAWVINNVINPLIKAIKAIGGAVGVSAVSNLKGMSAPKGYAYGGIADPTGIMPGYTPNRDTGIIAVGGGEPVMRPEFGRAVGEGWVNAANAAARRGGIGGAKRFMAEQAYGRYQYLGGFASGGTVQPVPGKGNRHTSGYPWATWAGDFPVPTNTAVHAWKSGAVAMVKYLTTSYGRHVRINHDDGSSSLYAHLNTIAVKAGQKIAAGQVIAKSDSTGNSTGPHLHFETMGKPYSGGTAVADTGVGVGMLNKIKNLMTVAMPGKFGNSIWAQTVAAAPKTLAKGAVSKFKDLVGSLMDSASGLLSGTSKWIGSKFAGLSGEQRTNAATIIDVARKLGFGDRGAIIGIITSLVESGLRNVKYGDRDSVGLFQQRAPWGSFADRTNPAKSASMFFQGGQGGQPGLKSKAWRSGSYGALAQAVQVSAFPGRYSLQVPRALAILAAFGKGGIGKGSKSNNTFDNGGWLPAGLSMAYNGTGRGENKAVFTEQQWQMLQGLASDQRQRTSNGSEQPVHVHFHGIVDSASAAREIEQLLLRRGRITGGVDLPSRSRRVVRST